MEQNAISMTLIHNLFWLSMFFLIFIFILFFSVHQNIPIFINAELEDGKRNTQIYGCSDYETSFHCEPLNSIWKSYAIPGKEIEVYPATRNDSTYVMGKFDKALQMHEEYREYAEISNTPYYNSKQFSVSFWIKPIPNTNPYGHRIISID